MEVPRLIKKPVRVQAMEGGPLKTAHSEEKWYDYIYTKKRYKKWQYKDLERNQ